MEIRVEIKLPSRIRGGRSLKRVFMRPNERALVTPFMHCAAISLHHMIGYEIVSSWANVRCLQTDLPCCKTPMLDVVMRTMIQ